MNHSHPQIHHRLITARSMRRSRLAQLERKATGVYLSLPKLVRLHYPAALFGFAVISFVPGLLHVDSTPISLAFHAVVLMLALGVLITRRPGFKIQPSFGFTIFILFWLVYSSRLIGDLAIRHVSTARPMYIYWTFAYGITFIPALAYFKSFPRSDYKFIAPVIWATLALVCFLSLALGLRSLGAQSGRLSGNDIFNPIDLGHIGSALTALSLGSLLQRKEVKRIPASLALPAICLGIIVLLLAGSRGPLVGFLGILFILVITHFRGRRGFVIVFLVGAMAAATPFMLSKLQQAGGSLTQRVQSVNGSDKIDSDIRIVLWRAALQDISQHPLTGEALEIPGMGYPHQIVLESFLATGVVGGTLFLILIFHGLLLAWRVIREGNEPMWVGMLYVQYLSASFFSGTIYDNFGFWCCYAFLVGSTYGKAVSRRPVVRPGAPYLTRKALPKAG